MHVFVSVGAGRTASQRRSPVARDLLSSCVRVRPEQRASVAALLKHDFLRDAWKGVSEQKSRTLGRRQLDDQQHELKKSFSLVVSGAGESA